MLTIYGAHVYGIMISLIFMLLIFAIGMSVYKNRAQVKFYSILLREDGHISKVSIAFLFILPIIIYQAIYLNQITPGLDYILLTIFASEIGVKLTEKLPTKQYPHDPNKPVDTTKEPK